MKQKSQSPQTLERFIDPCARVEGLLEIVRVSLDAPGLGVYGRGPDFNRARHAAMPLVRTVQGLNRAAFWEFLWIPQTRRSQAEEIIQQQSEVLRVAREQLVGGDVTRADIIGAIDALHEVVISMQSMFSIARVRGLDEPDDSWALDRFRCAALLPVLAEQLDKFWQELHRSQHTRELVTETA